MAIVGYWRLNGNSNDASGNSNNGTDTSMTYPLGRLDLGAKFNGSSGFIKITVSNSMKLTSSGTISVWFCPTNTVGVGSGAPHLMRTHNVASTIVGNDLYVSNGSGKLFFFNDMSAVYCASNATSWTGGVWYHALVTSNGTTLTMYINSVIQTTTGNITGLNFMCQGGTIAIGSASYLSPYQYWNGWGDEIKIDNTAWTNAKVKNEYSRVKGFF